MKVLDESSQGAVTGATVALDALGLPVNGTGGLLIVFWKDA